MLRWIVSVCLAHLALAEFNVKFNQLLDGQLAMVNGGLAKSDVHSVPLGDKTINGATIKGISLSDIATFQRIGDATMKTLDDSTLQVSSTIGLKDMVFHIDSYSSPDASYQNASFVVKSNAVSWSYSVSFTSAGGCSIAIQDLEITSLDDVTLYSNDPKMNDVDVSKEFQQVKQTLNDFFKSPNFAALVQKYDVCKADTSAWTGLFNVFA